MDLKEDFCSNIMVSKQYYFKHFVSSNFSQFCFLTAAGFEPTHLFCMLVHEARYLYEINWIKQKAFVKTCGNRKKKKLHSVSM